MRSSLPCYWRGALTYVKRRWRTPYRRTVRRGRSIRVLFKDSVLGPYY